MLTRSSRLQRALTIKDNATVIFKNAKEQLNEATIRLNDHITESIRIISSKEKEIADEKALIEVTRGHVRNATETIVKINNILGE